MKKWITEKSTWTFLQNCFPNFGLKTHLNVHHACCIFIWFYDRSVNYVKYILYYLWQSIGFLFLPSILKTIDPFLTTNALIKLGGVTNVARFDFQFFYILFVLSSLHLLLFYYAFVRSDSVKRFQYILAATSIFMII